MLGGTHLHAIQLDMIWPDPQIVNRIKYMYPNVLIILQISTRSFEQVENNLSKLLEKLNEYEQSLSHVLLDRSVGRGIAMESDMLLPVVQFLKEKRPDLGIAVAGGLGPETIYLAEPLIKEFPDLSIDAQGRLRPSGSALDPIDWNMAKEYLRNALQMFQTHKVQ
jgi:phosphoribosylanthranilate isomerase